MCHSGNLASFYSCSDISPFVKPYSSFSSLILILYEITALDSCVNSTTDISLYEYASDILIPKRVL